MAARFGISILMIFILGSCGSPEHIPSSTLNSVTQQKDDSFALISTNILQPKCASCHSGTKPAGEIDLSTYASVMAAKGVVVAGDPTHSSIYSEVKTGDMPDSGPVLSANEVQAIFDWIAAGAPDGSFNPGTVPVTPAPPAPTPTPTPAPPPATATFSEVQAQILNVSCTSCHSGVKPSGKIDLSSYAKLMANNKAGLILPGNSAKSLLYTEVATGDMPPKGTKVSAANTQLLKQWIDAGAQNN